jgi:small subunit ribosomal protein S16
MSVTIRLRRVGRKKQPYYRVVVTDSRNSRSGAYLEAVGHYSSTTHPAELRLDLPRVDEWLAQGAEMSDTVRSLVNKARKGGDEEVVFHAAQAETPAAATAEAPAAAAPATPAAETPAAEAPAPE